MIHKSQYAKAVTSLVAFALFVSGCTKTRDAALPDEAQESVFAISEFGEIQTDQSPYKIQTEARAEALSLGESAKATAEKGLVTAGDVNVPERLKFMFKGLEMTGQAGVSYPITLSVDKQFVTAYKIVRDVNQLTLLEKQIAQAKEEVQLQKQIQRTKDNTKVKNLLANLKQARGQKAQILQQNSGVLLVPLFKFKVKAYGILQRNKNELKEETSVLRLKATDWSEATHIHMDIAASERMAIGIDPANSGDLDRTFVMNNINNKIMTAGMLKDDFQLPVNLADEAKVLTLLDVDALHVFEIGNKTKLKLSDSQLQQLKLGSNKSNVRQCPAEISKLMPADIKEDCVMILRFDFAVSYVKPQLPAVDYEGNQSSRISFESVPARNNVGLVQIQKAEPKKIEDNNEMDPRSTLRIADIKDKEFFFRRTLQDAPVTTMIPPGMSGHLAVVRFELQENRLAVVNADKLANFKSGSNSTDTEEILSFPVKYFKHDTQSSSGADYSVSRLVPTSRAQAEYMQIDWTENKLSSNYSPYDTLQAYCIKSIADQSVSDVEMKMDKGVLNFSIDYSVGLSAYCITDYPISNSYNGTPSYQTTARLKERISFKAYDESINKPFAPQVPFRAQNEMGYGVWTIGKMKPTDEGLIGREGQEEHYPVVHDFRNGKKLVYTVTGLEKEVDLPAEIRALYRETVIEIVDSWDAAYKQAFKGTSLKRDGRYVEVKFSGDPGVKATVGDLNANIIHFENKTNIHHGILGVSQVGYNPRSGIVTADSLIIYAGNLRSYVAGDQRDQQIATQWDEMKATFRQQALQELDKAQKAQIEAQKLAAQQAQAGQAEKTPLAPAGDTEQKGEVAKLFGKKLLQLADKPSLKLNTQNLHTRSLRPATNDILKAVAQTKALGIKDNKLALSESLAAMPGAWMDKVSDKFKQNPQMDEMELEGIVAEEVLKSEGARLSGFQKNLLEQTRRRGVMRAKLNESFKSRPGCMMTQRESLNAAFAKKSGIEALRQGLRFDLAHEMGHSQGLTHNFIASMDKANFNGEDGSKSERNYSSVMDYFPPQYFNWGGIGTYDVHALRASHLGLLEVTPEFKKHAESKGQGDLLVDGKYITLPTMKNSFARNGWNNFSKRNIKGVLRDYKYCTDIHVGYEPTCQRFDYGTNAAEIVENMIKDFETRYTLGYYAWDKNNFTLGSFYRSYSVSYYYMQEMRQFLDELFYTLVTDRTNQEKISDYVQASFRVYTFLNQLIRTPDTDAGFMDNERFIAVPFTYDEVDADGNPTGKKLQDVEIVQKKSLYNRMSSDERLDTIGIEYDKSLALNFLTIKGYPAEKYYRNNISFSFLDFEKYVLGMQTETSLFGGTITGIMLDQLDPTFTNSYVTLSPLEGEKAEVTAVMRSRAAIGAILNLEALTLRDKDNYANAFKVGSSVGTPKGDRVSLSNVGVSSSSESRVSYWALDNAVGAQRIIGTAAEKAFYLANAEEIKARLEALLIAQVQDIMSQGKQQEVVAKATASVVAFLTELNKDGKVISKEVMAANPQATIQNLVDGIVQMNLQTFQFAVAEVIKGKNDEMAAQMMAQSEMLAKAAPIYALQQGALLSGLQKIAQQFGKVPGLEVTAQLPAAAERTVAGDSGLEYSYGIIIKNLEFLNMLTNMTNPEYAR